MKRAAAMTSLLLWTLACGSPSASTPASTSPGHSGGIAGNLACRLPVTSPTTGNEPLGGWVTFPGGDFVRDPASLPARTETGFVSYNRAIGAWVPADAQNVAPDGSTYVLTNSNGTPPLYLVDARTGKQRLILPQEQEGPIPGSLWKVVNYASEGVYLWTGNGGMEKPVPGLWSLDPETGVVRLIDGSHYWGMVSGGYAWALDAAGTRADASKVYRLDLRTGQVSTLYESSRDVALISPTPDGEILIDYGEIGSPRLASLAGPGTFAPVELPPGFPTVDRARPAPEGVWISVYGELWSGIALYVKGEGVTVMARSTHPLDAAGICA
jgi:hypothetical protein